MSKLAVIFALFLCALDGRADDRFWIAGKVNRKSVTFIFDTGSELCCFFSGSAGNAGLTNLPGRRTTEDCDLALGTNQSRMWFETLDTPAIAAKFPSILGWKLLKSNILQFDAETGLIRPLNRLPDDITTWKKVWLLDYPILA